MSRREVWLTLGLMLVMSYAVALTVLLAFWPHTVTIMPPCFVRVQGSHLPPGGRWC